jgi:ankyrin repeat protein
MDTLSHQQFKIHKALMRAGGFDSFQTALFDFTDQMQSFDQFRRTPLYIAARLGKEKEADSLLSMGVDVNVKGPHGNTPLHAASCAARKNLVIKLLAHGADQTILNDDGKTPLEMTDLDRIANLFLSQYPLILFLFMLTSRRKQR